DYYCYSSDSSGGLF
nr:immunoglobulin light chain junction region [Macaca mulatta]MOW04518.1 immunoglobulin light chain junction region [Macaca mulatta]